MLFESNHRERAVGYNITIKFENWVKRVVTVLNVTYLHAWLENGHNAGR